MITDTSRRELLMSHFSGKFTEELKRYEREPPSPEDLLARRRLKMALATVCHHYPDGARILDLGCGVGLGASVLSELGYDVTAVELVPALYEEAKRRGHDSVTWLNEAFSSDVGEKQSFDVVLSLGFLEYQERAGKELVKMRRLLKPGAHLILSVPNTLSTKLLLGLKRAVFRLKSEPESEPLRNCYTPERLQRLLGMAGFIFMDYQWLPRGEGGQPLHLDRERNSWEHRWRNRAALEFLSLSRTYTDRDTAPSY